MRSFRKEYCDVCVAPRQCRQSSAWRAHKTELFDDIDVVDFDCPRALPIKRDVRPRAQSLVDRYHEARHVKKTQCRYCKVCCGGKIQCYRDGAKPRTVTGGDCNVQCTFRKE